MRLTVLHILFTLVASPLFMGVINRTKALFAGRRGQPLFQWYYDLYKLLRKGAVYSRTTTFIFRLQPVIGLTTVLMALAFLPAGGAAALFSFNADFIFVVYLLGLFRLFLVLAALDTGSSFEGMGASREVQFAAFSEPAFFLGLAALALYTRSSSLSQIYAGFSASTWQAIGPVLVLVISAFFIILLTENSRVPVDDPNTHLELTMIHEVMILDYSGPDLACVLYTASLKLWLFSSLIVGFLLPFHTQNVLMDYGIFLCGMLSVAVTVGIVESTLARFRLLRIPQLLVAALGLSVLAFILQMKG